jgi:hypothetical protein
VHFYSKLWRFSRPNRGTVNYCRASDAASRRDVARRARCARAAPASVSGPTQTHPEVPHLPEVPRPEAGSTPRRLEVA